MPTSRPNHLSELMNTVLRLKPKSILDIGCGIGTRGALFREYTDFWQAGDEYPDFNTLIHGVEIFSKYINKVHEWAYSKIFIDDILNIIDDLPDYDLIFAGDVLEHFTREDGLLLLKKMKAHAKHVIIVTPVTVGNQGAVYGNEHEKHLSQWGKGDFVGHRIVLEGNAMFVHITTTIQCHYCQGMEFYGDKLPFPPYSDTHAPTFFLGLYFQEDYQCFCMHSGVRVVFWNGSDVLRLQNNVAWQKILLSRKVTHYCHNTQLRDELKQLGIIAEICPIFFGYKSSYKPSLKKLDNPNVFMCAHPGREEEYGVQIMHKVAVACPECVFHVYGVDGPSKGNVNYHGLVGESAMDEEIKTMQACLRCNQHDGVSQIGLKAKLLGLYFIQSSSVEEIANQLRNLYKQEPVNDVQNILDMSTISRLMESV